MRATISLFRSVTLVARVFEVVMDWMPTIKLSESLLTSGKLAVV